MPRLPQTFHGKNPARKIGNLTPKPFLANERSECKPDRAPPSRDERSECKPDRAQPSRDERSECKPDRAQPSRDERSECKPDRAQPSGNERARQYPAAGSGNVEICDPRATHQS